MIYPKACDHGSKRNSKGYTENWVGYKLHLDVADGQIPIGAILTSASVHDSQVAIPLSALTRERVTNLYDLMDAAYDSQIIRDHSRSLGDDSGGGGFAELKEKSRPDDLIQKSGE